MIRNSGDGDLAAPTSATASKVSGKRKSCGDQGSPGAIAGQPDSWRADISTVPQLDAAILQQVRDLGYYPQEFKNPKIREENMSSSCVGTLKVNGKSSRTTQKQSSRSGNKK